MKNKKDRSPDNTTVTFSCPKELKALIVKEASAEYRTVSNYLVKTFKEYLDEQKKCGDQ